MCVCVVHVSELSAGINGVRNREKAKDVVAHVPMHRCIVTHIGEGRLRWFKGDSNDLRAVEWFTRNSNGLRATRWFNINKKN